MTTNATLMKADLAIGDFSGAGKGGLLNPEQALTFIRKLIKSPTMLRVARIVEMLAPQRNINKIGFGKRILRKGVSATALDTAAIQGVFDPVAEATARSAPVTEQIQLNTKEVIAEILIPYDVMEDQIERAQVANNEGSNQGPGALRQTIIEMIAERAALDLEELGLLADTTIGAADDFLDLTEGFLRRTTLGGNTADQSNATVSKALFKSGLKTMPDQYLRNRSALSHFISVNNEIEYRDTLADRGTALGDAMTTGQSPAFAYGAPVFAASLMPEDKGLFTNPLNLIMGIQRQVSLEYDKDISTRVYKIVLTARVDFQIEEAEAAVIYTNIG